MNIVYNIMVFLHIIGAAMIVGIWIGQMKKPTVHPRQFDGAVLQLITGIVMMGLHPGPGHGRQLLQARHQAGHRPRRRSCSPSSAAASTRRAKPVSKGLAHSVGGLALLNVAIATLWQ